MNCPSCEREQHIGPCPHNRSHNVLPKGDQRKPFIPGKPGQILDKDSDGDLVWSDQKPREFWISRRKVLVDDEDYAFLSRFSWYVRKDKNVYYVFTNIYFNNKKSQISMHRLITGIRNVQIDHRNRNGLDNRKSNLRAASASQNSINHIRKNKFGFRGVFKPKKSPNYSFQIQVDGKRVTKNGFKTPEAAAREYDKWSKEAHGEFGIRNFKD